MRWGVICVFDDLRSVQPIAKQPLLTTILLMKTLTIKVPDFLNASLDSVAATRRTTKSAVVRDLLIKSLPVVAATPSRKAASPSLHDRLKHYQDAGPTGVTDLASNPKHMSGYGLK